MITAVIIMYGFNAYIITLYIVVCDWEVIATEM